MRLSIPPGSVGEWKDDPTFPKPLVSPNSQLAAASFGEDKEKIHVFYQADDDFLKELKYEEEEGWNSGVNDGNEGNELPKGYSGSSLAVLSLGPENLRLFYQGEDGKIHELYRDSENDWRQRMFIKFLTSVHIPSPH